MHTHGVNAAPRSASVSALEHFPTELSLPTLWICLLSLVAPSIVSSISSGSQYCITTPFQSSTNLLVPGVTSRNRNHGSVQPNCGFPLRCLLKQADSAPLASSDWSFIHTWSTCSIYFPSKRIAPDCSCLASDDSFARHIRLGESPTASPI